MEEGQDRHIKEHFWKWKLKNGHWPVINLPFPNDALQYWNSDKSNKQCGSSIDSAWIWKNINTQSKKKTKNQNRGIIFFDRIKKYKKDIKIGVDIAQEIDIVQHDDLQ